MVFGLSPAGSALLAAMGFLVDGRPGSAFRLVLGNTALLIAFFDVLGHSLLFVGIARLVATRHDGLHIFYRSISEGAERFSRGDNFSLAAPHFVSERSRRNPERPFGREVDPSNGRRSRCVSFSECSWHRPLRFRP